MSSRFVSICRIEMEFGNAKYLSHLDLVEERLPVVDKKPPVSSVLEPDLFRMQGGFLASSSVVVLPTSSSG